MAALAAAPILEKAVGSEKFRQKDMQEMHSLLRHECRAFDTGWYKSETQGCLSFLTASLKLAVL